MMDRQTVCRKQWHRYGRRKGFSLLESMMAILIVSFGVLGIMRLQSSAITANNDAKLRSEASLLANEMIGLLWSDRTNLDQYKLNSDKTPCEPGSNAAPATLSALVNWIGKVEELLPQAETLAQTIKIDANRIVTVTVCWRAPQDRTEHRHEALTQIQG